ncbi:putative amidoligase domain-containing protein [Brevibacillus sp. B_LB10_24]|uniref:putative amidoligase domain-containing protein n=1 Tax=Brevibacillus sp. B_LB10_24 TaxID=3380645 RepID=UPI0038B7D8EE
MTTANTMSILLNPVPALELCRDYRRMMSVLKLHGIPTLLLRQRGQVGEAGSRPQRSYLVHLFQQRVLGLGMAESQGVWLMGQVVNPEELAFLPAQKREGAEIKRVIACAIRSLYAVGLDYGSVLIAALSPTRIRVMDVAPGMERGEPLSLVYAEALRNFLQQVGDEQQKQTGVTLGADPEFALRSKTGEMGIASAFLGKHGIAGCDFARTENRLENRFPLVELRPEPADEPDLLLRHLFRAMQIARSKIDESWEWIAGGMPFQGFPIGGHIHFSGVLPTFHLARKLDSYLSLPLSLVEDSGSRERRPKYGFLGDVRKQPYGGFEYRTLPSWLVTPQIARGVLTMAKLVAEQQWLLSRMPSTDLGVQMAYYKADTAFLRPIVRDLLKEMTFLPMYRHYEQVLEPFFRFLTSGKSWPAGQDFRPAWGLLPSTSQNNHAIIRGEIGKLGVVYQ